MSILLKGQPARRSVLRGMLKGSAVAVALPFLDCFLNDHGKALAVGAPMPVRFGTWFWGLGHSKGFGFSDKPELEFLMETQVLERHRNNMNFLNGFNSPLDGKANYVHYSGLIALRSGSSATSTDQVPAPTLDVLVSDAIGDGTRFRSIDLAASNGARASYSARNSGSRNAAEGSPVALYARLFGPGFADPNKADFKPDPEVMLRQSVLSGINEDRQRLMNRLGAADKARMDEYFTSVRELEKQLALQLQKPEPNKACVVPASHVDAFATEEDESRAGANADEGGRGAEIEATVSNHLVLTKLLSMALACNQTKVFTMTFSVALSNLRRKGSADTHHTLSHDEPADPKLGYQTGVSWFNRRSMEACANFVDAFAAIKEGDGTLLDNTLIFAHSDTNEAIVHAIDSIPVMTFGKAGGRLKTGVRVLGNGDPVTRVGLTAMQAVGVPIENWGTKSLQTSKPVSEILA